MHDPSGIEEIGGYSSVEAIGRNKSLQGQSMKVDGVASSSSWIVNMEKKDQWEKTSIYRVPKWIKNLTNKDAYRPWLVSLGPFHHGEPELLPMEEHKRRAVLHLVNKRSKKKLGEFVDAIEEIADKLREAYQDLDYKWHRENSGFVEMMVTDGCFLLEFMRAFTRIRSKTVDDYTDNDPVFSKHGILNLYRAIRSDMLVMENQLPLLALQTLEDLQDDAPETNINIRMCEFLCPPSDTKKTGDRSDTKKTGDRSDTKKTGDRSDTKKSEDNDKELEGMKGDLHLHPLDILHIRICGGSLEHKPTNNPDVVIPTATELREAGILFKKSATDSVCDMKFKNGVLCIPERVVDDGTEKEFLNLRVFEQLHSGAGTHVINYLSVMDNMIDSERDAELLRSKGIVTNRLRNDKALADLFNSLNCGATTHQHKELNDTLQEINAHCSKRRHKWRAFMRTYMRNPWVFISLLAAIILLLATLTQTAYTIVPFYTKS